MLKKLFEYLENLQWDILIAWHEYQKLLRATGHKVKKLSLLSEDMLKRGSFGRLLLSAKDRLKSFFLGISLLRKPLEYIIKIVKVIDDWIEQKKRPSVKKAMIFQLEDKKFKKQLKNRVFQNNSKPLHFSGVKKEDPQNDSAKSFREQLEKLFE